MQSEQRKTSAESFPRSVAGTVLVSLLVYAFMGESSRRSHLERETRELRADHPEPVNTPTVSGVAT